MTTISRPLLKTLRAEIDAALAAVGEKHGLTIETGNASFSASEATFKLKVIAGSAEEAARREWDRFVQFGSSYTLSSRDFGREFRLGGKTFRISGAAPNSPKYPVLATQVVGRKGSNPGRNGKVYKFPTRSVVDALQAQG